jgi:perosamine synthetase
MSDGFLRRDRIGANPQVFSHEDEVQKRKNRDGTGPGRMERGMTLAEKQAFLPYGHQWIDDEDIAAVVAILKGDWLTMGPTVDAFENALAEKVGVRHAVSFSSGTAALHGAMYAAGVGHGDEVIVPPMTFAATSNAALYLGGLPRFADIAPETWCLDPAAAQQVVSDRTKAIVPVSFTGFPLPLESFRALAEQVGAVLIEDACHTLGGEREGRKVGRDADMTVFSFHPVKHITTGEGGMVVTDDDEFARRLRLFRSHGITKDPAQMRTEPHGPWYTEMQDLGYNYRLTDLGSALGLSQLRRLDAFVSRRRELAACYDRLLPELNGTTSAPVVETPPAHPGHAYHLYAANFEPAVRKHLFEELRKAGIGVQVHYLPVHLHRYYRERFGWKEGDFPVAERLYRGEISLPLFPSMENDDVSRVVEEIRSILGKL